MSKRVVCKFGGSSLANASQIQKVRDIVRADVNRRIVVVSAPGRSDAAEQKITDHLINVATRGRHFYDQRLAITAEASKEAVLTRFAEIIDDLGIEGSTVVDDLRRDLESDLEGDKRVAFLASRGEHYNARVVSEDFTLSGMNAKPMLPEDFGLILGGNFLNAKLEDEAYANMAALESEEGVIVIPGFYGVTAAGEVAVFSRGGSDLTAGELAGALNAATYENWTDVSGVFEADPRLIPEARAIPRLTFKEIRLLSCRGFNVFHLDAMLPCKERKVPIHIRNTNEPGHPGTVILFERVPEEGVVGIARLDNVAFLYLEKDLLGEEPGFIAELLKIFQEFDIHCYHYPTDKDDMAVLVDQDDLTGSINDLRRRIEQQLKPDFMDVVYNLAILTPVGLGLTGNSYPIVDAIKALGDNHLTIEMMGQSPSQICFHIGVRQALADEALRVLYKSLIG